MEQLLSRLGAAGALIGVVLAGSPARADCSAWQPTTNSPTFVYSPDCTFKDIENMQRANEAALPVTRGDIDRLLAEIHGLRADMARRAAP